MTTWVPKSFLPLVLLIYSTSAFSAQSSAPIDFDCDVPADHFSSVSQDLSGLLTISGSVRVIVMRSGYNLPVAGARIVSPDGKSSVGFQLVAASSHAKQFDVVLNTERGGDFKRRTVAQGPAQTAIPFRLSLADSGKATLVIGSMAFDADFHPLTSANGMAFCSTAEFKFTGLAFSAS